MAKEFLWVTNTKENVQFYSDSAPKSGLSLHFSPYIDCDTKKHICDYVRYLRKEFFFPIRCNVYFSAKEKFASPKGGYCYGVFFSNEENKQTKRHIYPQIYIPTKCGLFQAFHSLSHELTHYFQWYFFEDQKKSGRSLEISAGKYAKRIVEDYCHDACKRPESACKHCYLDKPQGETP